jgi:subtilisin family serine protease
MSIGAIGPGSAASPASLEPIADPAASAPAAPAAPGAPPAAAALGLPAERPATPAAPATAIGAARMLYGATGGIEGKDEEFAALAAYVGRAKDVTVAVLDSGVALDHPLFADNKFVNPGEVPGDGIDNDANGLVDDVSGWDFGAKTGTPALDPKADYHGTHVAGIAAYGTEKIKILAMRTPREQPTSATGNANFQAIEYARKMGARVVNMSVSPTGPDSYFWLRTAIDRNPDLLFINSAGNSSFDVDAKDDSATFEEALAEDDLGKAKGAMFKAALPEENLLIVANATREGTLYEGSNYGAESVDLAAVGTKVRSALLPGSPDATKSADGGDYGELTGTSMSAPFVANVGAKLFSLCPSLTAIEARKILLDTVDAAQGLKGKVATGGVINSVRAYRCAALVAKVESGARIEEAASSLPGGPLDVAEKDRIVQCALQVLAARAKRAQAGGEGG